MNLHFFGQKAQHLRAEVKDAQDYDSIFKCFKKHHLTKAEAQFLFEKIVEEKLPLYICDELLRCICLMDASAPILFSLSKLFGQNVYDYFGQDTSLLMPGVHRKPLAEFYRRLDKIMALPDEFSVIKDSVMYTILTQGLCLEWDEKTGENTTIKHKDNFELEYERFGKHTKKRVAYYEKNPEIEIERVYLRGLKNKDIYDLCLKKMS